MRKLLGSVALVSVALSGTADAQTARWGGFYGGLTAGAILEHSGSAVTDPRITSTTTNPENENGMVAAFSTSAGKSDRGFAAGGQLGYNFLLSQLLIAGIESDLQKTWLKSSYSTTSIVTVTPGFASWQGTVNGMRSLSYLGTVRGRLVPGIISR